MSPHDLVMRRIVSSLNKANSMSKKMLAGQTAVIERMLAEVVKLCRDCSVVDTRIVTAKLQSDSTLLWHCPHCGIDAFGYDYSVGVHGHICAWCGELYRVEV